MVYSGKHVDCLLRKPIFTLVQAGVPCKWARDSQRLLLEWFDPIYNSPVQLYHHALPFCPSSSWLHKCYTTEDLQVVKVVKGLPVEWGMCTRTVTLANIPLALACWKDTILVSLVSGDIITFDRITGSQMAILSGHTDWVRSLAFWPDGTSLVSGSDDRTIKLWDMQTGGVVKTFYGHIDCILSVSISADCTTIASGSRDGTIHLWDIQTEECYHVIRQQDWVDSVRFSPTDPHHLISVSGDKVWHWDINGCQTNPEQDCDYIAFSLDGSWFVLCQGRDIVVQNTDSGVIVANFHVDSSILACCLSPDGRLTAVAAGHTAYVWDTTNSHPHPIKTFVGHTHDITSLVFSSPFSLISLSHDRTVKFWQIGALPTDPVVTGPESTPLTSAPIRSITLLAEDGIAISSDSEGVVRTWDISTGLCNVTFQTPAKDPDRSGVQLVNGRLIFIYHVDQDEKLYIWDVENGELLQTVTLGKDGNRYIEDFQISEDGLRVACLYGQLVRAWSIQTGVVVGEVGLEKCQVMRCLTMDGSGVWVHSPESEPLGWNFGIPGSLPVQLSNSPLLHPNNTKVWDIDSSRIKDTVTGEVVFQLAKRFANFTYWQWDGQYLVAGYNSGEVLILDFKHVLS